MVSRDSDEEEYSPPVKRRKVQPTKEQILKQRLQSSNLPSSVKRDALQRLESSDKEKNVEWVENLLKIPFGKVRPLPVNRDDSPSKIKKYFLKAQKMLDTAVYGMKNVKEEVLNYIAQFISTDTKSTPRIIGLCGSPGTGKTCIIRKGFAKALDRPIQCLSMGGLRDSNYFLGHDYTYVGSRYGIIVQSLISHQCMNGIIFMDEIDKVSGYDGSEIQNMLMHLTDPAQNYEFHDKYFSGINIDLSKVIIVFGMNDEKLIDPILRDRIHIIHVPDPTMKEKVTIGKDYLLREIESNIGFKQGEIELEPEVVEYMIKKFCKDQKGVRKLKKCIESILLKVNTGRYLWGKEQPYKCLKEMKMPFKVTKDVVDELIDFKEPEDKYLTSMYL